MNWSGRCAAPFMHSHGTHSPRLILLILLGLPRQHARRQQAGWQSTQLYCAAPAPKTPLATVLYTGNIEHADRRSQPEGQPSKDQGSPSALTGVLPAPPPLCPLSLALWCSSGGGSSSGFLAVWILELLVPLTALVSNANSGSSLSISLASIAAPVPHTVNSPRPLPLSAPAHPSHPPHPIYNLHSLVLVLGIGNSVAYTRRLLERALAIISTTLHHCHHQSICCFAVLFRHHVLRVPAQARISSSRPTTSHPKAAP